NTMRCRKVITTCSRPKSANRSRSVATSRPCAITGLRAPNWNAPWAVAGRRKLLLRRLQNEIPKNTNTSIERREKFMRVNRRKFFAGAAAAAGGALMTRFVPTASAAETGKAAVSIGKTEPFNPGRRGYKPVITPNGLTLPWKLVNGVKVYHLIAEPVTHEFIS